LSSIRHARRDGLVQKTLPTGLRLAVRACAVAAVALSAAGALAPASQAAVMNFGSPLGVPATEDTAANLNYTGTNSIQYGTGATIHNDHDGADTAIWNTSLASGTAAAPAAGQVTNVTIEGCAQPAAGGPAPLTQFHVQAVTPQPGGGVLVDVTSQPFDLPVCGAGGAGASTLTGYAPINFCVHQGDYVAFNDEGGFDPSFYPSGVPYQVLGAVAGSTADSYIANNGTNNGAMMSPTTTSATNGFAANPGEELMLRSTLATGADATPLCPGGTAGVAPPVAQAGQPGGPPGLTIPHPQREGVTHQRVVGLSVYCAQATSCTGTVSLTAGLPASAASGSRGQTFGTATLSVPGRSGTHVAIHVSAATLALVRQHRGGVPATASVTLSNGTRVTQTITLLL